MIQHQMNATQPQYMFDFVQSEMQANNYLVSPGYTVYLLDQMNKILYEKTYQSMVSFDLTQRQIQTNQNDLQGQPITREEISQMIANALKDYNPHIPKKERRND